MARLDGKAVVRIVDKTTGDGIELPLGTCCGDFTQNFADLLDKVVEGKITFKDYIDENDSTNNKYTGVKAIFLDTAGNAVAETELDGTNGKSDYLDTGNQKIIRFKGSVAGSGTDTVYIASVKFTVVALDANDGQTPVELELGTNDYPSTSVFAKVDPTTNKKGIPVVPDNNNFEFVFEVSIK